MDDELIPKFQELIDKVSTFLVNVILSCERLVRYYVTAEDVLEEYLGDWLRDFEYKVLENPKETRSWLADVPILLIGDSIISIKLPNTEILYAHILKSEVKDFDKCVEAYSKLDESIKTLVNLVKEVGGTNG